MTTINIDKEKYAHQIADDLLTLPESKIIEVADFVHFMMEQVKVQHRGVPLHKTGLNRREASDLRRRLSTFDKDWSASGMEAYDDL